jgi:hypothetical protein
VLVAVGRRMGVWEREEKRMRNVCLVLVVWWCRGVGGLGAKGEVWGESIRPLKGVGEAGEGFSPARTCATRPTSATSAA